MPFIEQNSEIIIGNYCTILSFDTIAQQRYGHKCDNIFVFANKY